MHETATLSPAELNEEIVVATIEQAVGPLIAESQALSARVDALVRVHDQIAAALGEVGVRLSALEKEAGLSDSSPSPD